jgi:uncharacterized heparinase superfamily protein
VAHLGRLLRTVRHLKPVQVFNRITRRLIRAPVDLRPAPASRSLALAPTSFLTRQANWQGGEEFRFLNQVHSVSGAAGWDRPDVPRLWLYNLHYFDDLCRGDAAQMRGDHAGLIARWIGENLPAKGTGWEPYPASLRIVNWIKWAASGGHLDQAARGSLAVQLRNLGGKLEYHLLGNHLWSNAKALIFGGLFFDGPEAARWLEKGSRIFSAQLAEQVLADGGHFERSPSYHALALEDILDVINLSRAYGQDLPPAYDDAARRMAHWLVVMSEAGGGYLAWNDAPRGVAPGIHDLAPYLARLGLASGGAVRGGLNPLPDTGYFRFEQQGYTLWIDAGSIGPDYLPGHAHADTLNFELHVGGRPMVVDVGVSTYEVGLVRAYERGTAAHNTVQVGDIDQSEVWAGFRVGRRARIVDRLCDGDGLSAGHTGYRWMGVTHRRSFRVEKDCVVITDTVTPSQPATARFHLALDIRPERTADGISAGAVQFSFSGQETLALGRYPLALGFHDRRDAACITVQFTGRLETRIKLAG